MSDRLFSLDDVPEIPLLPEPRRRKGAARGSSSDARFQNDYPPEWHRCTKCGGSGRWTGTAMAANRGDVSDYVHAMTATRITFDAGVCPDCLGMGSLKARVRLEAGHRCVRCKHPYVPKGDAKMLARMKEREILAKFDPEAENDALRAAVREAYSTIEGSGGRWSVCDEQCVHLGSMRVWEPGLEPARWIELTDDELTHGTHLSYRATGNAVEAEWRILTVHHLDGDKANCRWWNLAALCQRCHLEIQGKVVMERVYPHEHSSWFRPFVAGYYAFVYEEREITREEAEERMEELLAYERIV